MNRVFVLYKHVTYKSGIQHSFLVDVFKHMRDAKSAAEETARGDGEGRWEADGWVHLGVTGHQTHDTRRWTFMNDAAPGDYAVYSVQSFKVRS